jgi:hypothetical protein
MMGRQGWRMGSDYKVKGSTLNTKFEYVRVRFGDDAEQALHDRFESREQFPILEAVWYEYALYVEILEAIADHHFEGDVSRLVDAGEFSAEKALTSVYQAFVRGDDFTEFLGRISALHRLFYSHGKMQVRLSNDRDGCEIAHRDKPACDEADLYVALGFYCQAARLHGLRGLNGSFALEADGALFTLNWA